MYECLIYLIPIFLGFSFGIFTGLIPGIHTNTLCSVLVALYFTGAFSDINILYTIAFIVSMAISHTFFDVFPSLFLGIPGDEVFALLPGHKMVKNGKGIEALNISVSGSLQGFIYCFIFCIILIILNILYKDLLKDFEQYIKDYIFYILFAVSVLLIYTDKNKLISLLVFILSGILGILTLGTPYVPNSDTSAFSGIFPALTGMFGMSGLILALFEKNETLPKQNLDYTNKFFYKIKSSFIGSIGGIITGFLPGLGSANAATTILILEDFINKKKKSSNGAEYLASTSAINTSDAVFSIMTLYFISKSRSGSSVAIEQIIPYNINLNQAMIILSAMGISVVLSFFLIHKLKKNIIVFFSTIAYKPLTLSIIVFLIFITYFTTSIWGIFILITATLLGMLPYFFEVRKGQMMGFFLIPVLIFFSTFQVQIIDFLHLNAKSKYLPSLAYQEIMTIFLSSIIVSIILYKLLKGKL